MTQEEFEKRSIRVSSKEFEVINEDYKASGLCIDEYCKQWRDKNKVRVARYREFEESLWEISAICGMISEIEVKGYEHDNREIAADQLLTKQEIIALEMADIKVVREHPFKFVNSKGKIEYRPDIKSMREVGYEVRKYIRTHI